MSNQKEKEFLKKDVKKYVNIMREDIIYKGLFITKKSNQENGKETFIVDSGTKSHMAQYCYHEGKTGILAKDLHVPRLCVKSLLRSMAPLAGALMLITSLLINELNCLLGNAM